MKSAMTCFTVRSNIHPTSAPTGTEDDMEGNNKADALCWGLTRWRKPGSRRSALFSFSNPDGSNDDIIYGISRTEMHLWVVRKNNCVTELLRHRRAAGAGKVTAGGDLQSTPHRVSSAGRQNYRSFLGI